MTTDEIAQLAIEADALRVEVAAWRRRRNEARRLGSRGEYPGAVGGDTEVLRVGKRAAGRVLDGRTWDDVPAVP
jgi:hypothetical protein